MTTIVSIKNKAEALTIDQDNKNKFTKEGRIEAGAEPETHTVVTTTPATCQIWETI